MDWPTSHDAWEAEDILPTQVARSGPGAVSSCVEIKFPAPQVYLTHWLNSTQVRTATSAVDAVIVCLHSPTTTRDPTSV